jgi:acetolactate synthase I/II/III large subunit
VVNPASAADMLVRTLADRGTRLIFGLPGGGPNLDVIGVGATAGLRFVLTHSETAAVIMAATSADLTGAPGAALVTRGPGLAAAINGIAHAALDRLPVIVIADSVPVQDAHRISHQRLDQQSLGSAVAKKAVTVYSDAVQALIEDSVDVASAHPRGPVVLNMDPGRSTAPAAGGGPAIKGFAAPASDLAPLEAALASAQRPVIILGFDAIPHTTALRSALVGSGIPVLHTYRARGVIPDSASEAAGLITGGTMEWPLLAAADLIVGMGVDAVEMIPAQWDYAARVVLVVESPANSAEYFTGALELTAPLADAAALLGRRAGPRQWRTAVGRAVKADAAGRLLAAARTRAGLMSPTEVVTTVRACTPPHAIATVDAGAHMLAVMPLWEVEEPHRLLISSGLATMGYALPAAIAAGLSRPGAPVVAFTGDGGLGMTLAEVETAVRMRLTVVVVVFNDSALSLIKVKQAPAGQGGEAAVSYGRVSYAGAATALGAVGVTVSDARSLTDALNAAMARSLPTVIDVMIDPACYPSVLELTRGAAGRADRPRLLPPARTERTGGSERTSQTTGDVADQLK